MSTGAIITGVLIAFMFLVSFTQWFYQLVTGLDRVIVNDIFVVYRAITWGLVSIVFMVGFFFNVGDGARMSKSRTERRVV